MNQQPVITAIAVAIVGVFVSGGNHPLASGAGATGIVASIEKAPVVADGDVTGKPFDYVITLDGSLDPQVAGRSLASGGTISVILPPEFDLSNIDPAFPLADLPTPFPPTPPLPPMPCLPGNLQCTTAVILKGWPQDPLFPPRAFTLLSIDLARNAFVYTAVQNITAFPGIKQLHLILNGVTNPAPGKYRVLVEAETGPGGSIERGEGLLTVRPRTKPSINVTSVFVKAHAGTLPGATGPACAPGSNPPNPDNPIYQTTGTGEDAPFVWTLLLWGADNAPLDGVTLRRAGRNRWLMVRNSSGSGDWDKDKDDDDSSDRQVIGQVRIKPPPGARGQTIRQIECPGMLPAAPVIAATPGIGPQPVGRLDLRFTTGNRPGLYTTTLSLRNGNRIQMFVTAD